MKVIDLLNKIANGEEVPKKIKWNDTKYIFFENTNQYYEDKGEKKVNTLYEFSLKARLYNFNMLNDEIEIIEEPKKIENISDEELEQCDCDYDRICLILDRLDEIIDYINNKENSNE